MNDLINGAFEFTAGLMTWLNVRQIIKDKKVRGYNLKVFMFFTLWGYWNLYYYPSLNQWWSFYGGISIMLANTIWLMLAIYYKRSESNLKRKPR